MKRNVGKVSLGAAAVIVVLMSGVAVFAIGASDREATDREVREIEKTLQRYVEVPYSFAPSVKRELLTSAAVPDESIEKARRDLHRNLLEVATEEHATESVDNGLGVIIPYPVERCPELNRERLMEGGAEVLAIEDIRFEATDRAVVTAIVWSGGRVGRFDSTTNRTEFFYAADSTTVIDYPMRLVDGQWRVSGISVHVKGTPLDECEATYGPPTTDPEEAKKMWRDVGYNSEGQRRRGLLRASGQ